MRKPGPPLHAGLTEAMSNRLLDEFLSSKNFFLDRKIAGKMPRIPKWERKEALKLVRVKGFCDPGGHLVSRRDGALRHSADDFRRPAPAPPQHKGKKGRKEKQRVQDDKIDMASFAQIMAERVQNKSSLSPKR